MIRYDLRAADNAALSAALAEAGIIRDNVTVIVDRIGLIFEATGEVDEGGLPIVEAIEGWHANLYCAEPLTDEQEAVLPIIPTPPAPVRVLAGEALI
jgi:hypothetical protein